MGLWLAIETSLKPLSLRKSLSLMHLIHSPHMALSSLLTRYTCLSGGSLSCDASKGDGWLGWPMRWSGCWMRWASRLS